MVHRLFNFPFRASVSAIEYRNRQITQKRQLNYGIKAETLVGHSIGGVFTVIADARNLVFRGFKIQTTDAGFA